jgi:tetratricopeptide (TPR) repeat protein
MQAAQTALLGGLAMAAVLTALSLLRREGLPTQVVAEIIVLTLLIAGVLTLTDTALHPLIMIFSLYTIVMRSRLLVDVGNIVARRNPAAADDFFILALRLWPDPLGRLSAIVNLAVNYLRRGQHAKAVDILKAALASQPTETPRKLEAAVRYNLGVAYEGLGQLGQALEEWRTVVRIFPNSPYGQGAQRAIQRAFQAHRPSE